MKTTFPSLVVFLLGVSLASAPAQPGMGGPKAPGFGGSLSKLLGETTAFSSAIEIQTKGPSGDNITLPGKMAFNEGKSRMELDMSKSMGDSVPAEALAQIKAMGMDSIVIIGRPEKKISYMAFPGLKAYFETEIPDTETAEATSKYKVESTELGKETVDGHDCAKNKVVISDKDGNKHESTVWNAKDLKDFPVKIEATEQGRTTVMKFKDISFKKPDAADFEAPASFTKYTSPQAMMQAMMAKQMGNSGMMGRPPGQ